MIEQKIDALIAALEANTAALKAAQSGASTTDKPAADKPAAEKAKATGTKGKAAAEKAGPKHSRSEVNAALNEVKENFDTATAKGVIKAAGFDKMADITEDKFDEVFDACKAKLAELGSDEGGEDDGM